MAFQRTVSGLIAKYLFFPGHSLIWVEGKTDIAFYDRILRGLPCRIEAAGGKEECQKLAMALVQNNLPYVVVLDGDYELLSRKRSMHRRVVILHRYSMENYLVEKVAIQKVCQNYTGMGDDDNFIGASFDEALDKVEDNLLEIIVTDVAHDLCQTTESALPRTVEAVILQEKALCFDEDRINAICNQKKQTLTTDFIERARNLVRDYKVKHRLVDLLRGHFAFSLIRRLFLTAVHRKTGRRPNIDNMSLKMLLITEVWELRTSEDHNSLKRRLRYAVNEAYSLRTTSVGR